MPAEPDHAPAGAVTPGRSAQRWEELLTSLAVILPPRAGGLVAVDGPAEQAGPFAARLAARLAARGRTQRVVADGAADPDVTIHLSTGPLRRSTAASGWTLTAYDDAPHRFYALAERTAERTA